MGVSKNRGEKNKMDGLFHGNNFIKMEDLTTWMSQEVIGSKVIGSLGYFTLIYPISKDRFRDIHPCLGEKSWNPNEKLRGFPGDEADGGSSASRFFNQHNDIYHRSS